MKKLILILVFIFCASNAFAGGISVHGGSRSAISIADKETGLTVNVEENGGLAINIQDQTTRAFDTRINQFDKTGITLASSPTINTYDATLTTGHGVITGDRLAIIEQNGIPQLWSGLVLNVVGDVVTLDSPVPFAFTTAATVITTIIDMSVDGSSTTEVFSITNIFAEAIDITRLIIHITDATVMDDSKFGGGVALTRGLVLRKKISSSQYINYWNVKNNGEFGELAYDKTYDPKAPAGVYGLTIRLTYGGQSKHGVVIRLEPGESIEILVQDNLTGQESFTIMFQGHSTQD